MARLFPWCMFELFVLSYCQTERLQGRPLDIKREPPKKRGKYILIGVGVAVLGVTTVALGNLEQRAPSVDRATLWIDSVHRGTLTRQVRAPGTLTPEHIRYVVAVTSGRVEAYPSAQASPSTPATMILELSNPDVQLEMLNAQSSRHERRAELRDAANLARIAAARSRKARLRTRARCTATRSVNTRRSRRSPRRSSRRPTGSRAHDGRVWTQPRSALPREEQRLKVNSEAIDQQLRLARANIDRLNAILRVPAGSRRVHECARRARAASCFRSATGQQELQLGQWVLAGQTLATVAQPGKLKAVLRVPETQAKDVALGQKVDIDTRAGGGGANTGIVKGHVSRVDPTSVNGTVTVEVLFDGTTPAGARADLSVDGVIEIERLDNVLLRTAAGVWSGREHRWPVQARSGRQDGEPREREARSQLGQHDRDRQRSATERQGHRVRHVAVGQRRESPTPMT